VKAVIAWIYDFALSTGGPGLFVVAFLDSSFVSLPQINDLLVVLMVIRSRSWMPYYAVMATLGSVAGCYVIYSIAEKGGEALLRRRLSHDRVERTLALYRRHGVLALIVPALLPPPAPFKLFVLLAGVAEVRPSRFVLAIVVARGVRYFAMGTLAILYGDLALDLMRTSGREIGLWLAALIVSGALVWWLWRRTRQAI
jgi:membrane protein YqaA with SNARE-associated domain